MSPDMEALIEQTMPKAQKGAARYALIYQRNRMAIDYDDCLGAAYEGLVYAASKYDPAKTNGASFYTYAFRWMDQRLRLLGKRERRAKGWAYDATKDEIAAGAERGRMIRIVKVGPMPYNRDGKELDIIPAPTRDDDHATSSARLEQREFILSWCNTDRERLIIRRLFEGVNGSAIAEELGITRQRVSQIVIVVRNRVIREIRPKRRVSGALRAKDLRQ